jgi:ATP/maltotriose-dependent transcriptional regulator MalT
MAFARSLAEFWQIYGLQHCGQTEAAVALASQWLRQQPEQPDVRALRQLLALCGIYYDRADVPALMATATTFREVAVRAQRGLSLGWANFLLGWAHYQSNELATAAEYFEQLARSPFGAHGRAVIDSLAGLALTRHAQGQEEEARAAVGSLRAFLLDSGTVDLMPVAASLAVRLASGQGPWDTPSDFARGLDAQLAADIWELPGLTAVRASILLGEPARLAAAAELLAQCRLLAETRHTKRRLIEIAILEASLRAAQGDDAATLAALQQAVALGEPGGGLRFFLDDGPGLRPYLQQLLDQGVAPAYVRAILAAYPAQSAVPPSPTYSLQVVDRDTVREPYPDDLLTNREIDVLLLLEQRLTNKEIATRLSISPRTVQKHAINIYQKLHVSNRRQAAARARALGLLP